MSKGDEISAVQLCSTGAGNYLDSHTSDAVPGDVCLGGFCVSRKDLFWETEES